jgi:hypothetical protein
MANQSTDQPRSATAPSSSAAPEDGVHSPRKAGTSSAYNQSLLNLLEATPSSCRPSRHFRDSRDSSFLEAVSSAGQAERGASDERYQRALEQAAAFAVERSAKYQQRFLSKSMPQDNAEQPSERSSDASILGASQFVLRNDQDSKEEDAGMQREILAPETDVSSSRLSVPPSLRDQGFGLRHSSLAPFRPNTSSSLSQDITPDDIASMDPADAMAIYRAADGGSDILSALPPHITRVSTGDPSENSSSEFSRQTTRKSASVDVSDDSEFFGGVVGQVHAFGRAQEQSPEPTSTEDVLRRSPRRAASGRAVRFT